MPRGHPSCDALGEPLTLDVRPPELADLVREVVDEQLDGPERDPSRVATSVVL
jgi:hypothetical protein